MAAAAREAKRAERAHRRITAAESLDEAEDAWADFLANASNVFAKLRAACRGHPLDWGWYGKKLDERSRDPLLLYIHKARNASTHRLDDITERVAAGRRLTIAPGIGRVYVRFPIHIRPLPVVDQHGNVYEVPTSHRGVEFAYCDVVVMSHIAAKYLQDLVKEASSRRR